VRNYPLPIARRRRVPLGSPANGVPAGGKSGGQDAVGDRSRPSRGPFTGWVARHVGHPTADASASRPFARLAGHRPAGRARSTRPMSTAPARSGSLSSAAWRRSAVREHA